MIFCLCGKKLKDLKYNISISNISTAQASVHRSLKLAMEGCYGNAMNTFKSHGCAPRDDQSAFTELKCCHPVYEFPDWPEDIPSSLVVDSQAVLNAQKRGISKRY